MARLMTGADEIINPTPLNTISWTESYWIGACKISPALSYKRGYLQTLPSTHAYVSLFISLNNTISD